MGDRNSQAGAAAPPVVLTIAGFDPSNGAGITADLQVFAAHGLFGISAITALTVQSTQGVAAVEPVAPATLRRTLQHLYTDLPPAGIKIGMMGNRQTVGEVAAFLDSDGTGEHTPHPLPIVLDPVLRSSSGAEMLDHDGVETMLTQLAGKVSWLTPNYLELGHLAKCDVGNTAEAEKALCVLGSRYPHLHIVATGGDAAPEPFDLWRSPAGHIQRFEGRRIETTSTHGTGCAFSSALLSRLVLGHAPEDAILLAKSYVEGALQHAPGLGHGKGPLDLLWPMRR